MRQATEKGVYASSGCSSDASGALQRVRNMSWRLCARRLAAGPAHTHTCYTLNQTKNGKPCRSSAYLL